MRFPFIEDHREQHPARLICRALGVAPSGFYAWRSRPESGRAAAIRELLTDIHRVHAQHRGRYGSHRIHAALRTQGRTASRGRIKRLMRRHAIRGIAAGRFRTITNDGHQGLSIATDLLVQNFQAPAPKQVWLADMTYIPTGEGWLSLAAVLDLVTARW